jgi:hypothetical protein
MAEAALGRLLRSLAVAVTSCLTLTAAIHAAACATTRGSGAQEIEAVRVVPVDLPEAVSRAVDRALGLWNDACGRSFGVPVFARETHLPHRVLEVRWREAADPERPGVCGTFVGNQVQLFGSALDEWGVERSCGGPDRLSETFAHELGHALGLEDRHEPECGEFIMSRMVRLPEGTLLSRRVRPEECAAAERVFELAAGDGDGGGRPTEGGSAGSGFRRDRRRAADDPLKLVPVAAR